MACLWILCYLCLTSTLVFSQNHQLSFVSIRQHALLNTDLMNSEKDGYLQNSSLITYSTANQLNASASTGYLNFGIYPYALFWGMKSKNNSAMTLGIQGYGNNIFRYNSMSISYNRSLNQRIALGVQQSWTSINIPQSQIQHSTGTRVNISLRLEKLVLAFRCQRNFPINQKSNFLQKDEITTGILFPLGSLTGIYYTTTIATNWTHRLAIQQLLSQEIALWLAFQINPLLYGVGFSIPINSKMTLEVGDQYHPILGHDFGIGLVWKWNKKPTNQSNSQL